jgi:hypothetical protein
MNFCDFLHIHDKSPPDLTIDNKGLFQVLIVNRAFLEVQIHTRKRNKKGEMQ